MSNKIEILTIILAHNEEQNIRRAIHSAKKISKTIFSKNLDPTKKVYIKRSSAEEPPFRGGSTPCAQNGVASAGGGQFPTPRTEGSLCIKTLN